MKILITRTAPFKIFEKALEKVRNEFPCAEIHVLIQKSALNNLAMYEKNLVPLTVNNGPFSIWRVGLKFFKKLRKEQFDMIILLYTNPAGYGYINIDLMSFLSGSKKEIIFDHQGNFHPVHSSLKKIIKKLLYLLIGWSIYGIIQLLIFLWKPFLKLGHPWLTFSKFLYIKFGKNIKNDTHPKLADRSGKSGTVSSNREIKEHRKKRIVFIDLMFTWPPHGGACVDLKEVASRLISRGYEVDLIVPKFQGIFPRGNVDESLLPFTVHKVDFSTKTFNYIFLPGKIREKVDKLNPDYVYLGDSYFLKPFLIEALKKYRIIARFYTYELLCPNYYLLYRNEKKCDLNYLTHPTHCLKCAVEKMSYCIKTLDWEVWSHEFMMSLAFLPSYHKRVKHAISLCHSLITYNDLASKLLSTFHPRVFSFPGGVSTADFIPGGGSNNGVKKILVSGRLMDPRKGLKFFIEAAHRLRKERQDFEIYLTHDQKFTEDYIISLGWMDHGKLKSFYKEIDFCVVPSLWEEPFGMVAVEAMAAGKPVVASAVAGLKMSVEDRVTGFLFPPGDSGKLMESLNKLLDDPILVKKMGEAGRKRVVKYFDWNRVVDRYCNEIFEGYDK